MNHKDLKVNRIGPILIPDRTRVLLRPFFPLSKEIARRMISSVMALSEDKVSTILEQVLQDFSQRHEFVEPFFTKRADQILDMLGELPAMSRKQRLLAGAYFSHEYSPESTALFNPSIVKHPNQSGLPTGSLRFILSLRATGEHHISSITFRTGTLNARHRITMTPPVPFIAEPEPMVNASYQKDLFSRKLQEAGADSPFGKRILEHLEDSFTLENLHQAVEKVSSRNELNLDDNNHAIRRMMLLAESNHEVRFDPKSAISQRILFPSVPSERNGIEDARFVRFQDEDGQFSYYATYTAYDGRLTLPQLLETKDFVHFKFITLNGPAIQNKGMALFPRKIDGQFLMLSRQDDENILLMHSDNIHFWKNPKILLKPKYPWEFTKIGTCGSPIETEAGWLVLSHGVGPMRAYSLGAFLLDLKDPSKVLGRLSKPLMTPDQSERDGYVPNVLYTCGALLHGRELIIPYAMSDYATRFAHVNLDELLDIMSR